MRALLTCFGLALALAALTAPAAAQAPGAHHYTIEARLDPVAHAVDGRATIHWTNESTAPADELFFHLYLNAFASRNTVFMRGSRGVSRGNEAAGEGRIIVSSLVDSDGTDLLAGADDELIPDDHTQLRVPLPTPIPPGGEIDLEVTFRAELPPVFARAGYRRSFHAVAQWFPKLARRETDGTWRSFPYHPHGEFYADFARYEIEVDTPEEFVVGATGAMVHEARADGRVVRRFVADRVHDTAFIAWDQFQETTFEASGVAVRLLYPPGYEDAVVAHQQTVEAGLAHFGALLGPYAYDYLTVVVPPRGAKGAAGMEYPTLFLTAGPYYSLAAFPAIGQQSVTAHELGHQWFQGMVATDEDQSPFLDEGLTQWITGDLLRSMHGPRRSGLAWPIAIDFFELMRFASFRGAGDPPPNSPAASFHGTEYGRSVYARTSVALETVHRTWGRRRFTRALGHYARTHRFDHPTPRDLYAAFDRHYYRGFSAAVLAPALDEGAHASLTLRHFDSRPNDDAEREDGYVTDILALRRGGVMLPTWVELTYADGRRTRLPFPASAGEALAVTHESSQEVIGARLDPDGHDLLDATVRDRRAGKSPETKSQSPFGWLLHLLTLVTVGVAA